MHVFFVREAARSFRHHRGLSYTAVLALTAALTLTGVLLLLTHNARSALGMMGDRREMVVYLRDEVTDTERQALMARLGDLYGSVSYVSRDQAWEEFKAQVGDASLLEAVGDNPLPASLRLKLKPELLNHQAMSETAAQVSQFPEVEDVRFGAEWVRRLDRMSTWLGHGTLAVGLVVSIAVVFILYNTIRLTVLARRPQVEIMSRLGASDKFIATPFVLEAMFISALSAGLSLAVLFGLQQALALRIVGTAFLPVVWQLAFVGAAIGCAWIAGMMALSRVLRAVGP